MASFGKAKVAANKKQDTKLTLNDLLNGEAQNLTDELVDQLIEDSSQDGEDAESQEFESEEQEGEELPSQ